MENRASHAPLLICPRVLSEVDAEKYAWLGRKWITNTARLNTSSTQIFFLLVNPGLSGKWLILRLGQEIYKTSLRHSGVMCRIYKAMIIVLCQRGTKEKAERAITSQS